jgi:hypothetical protein
MFVEPVPQCLDCVLQWEEEAPDERVALRALLTPPAQELLDKNRSDRTDERADKRCDKCGQGSGHGPATHGGPNSWDIADQHAAVGLPANRSATHIHAAHPTATIYPPQERRRDLLGGLLHEYEAAA